MNCERCDRLVHPKCTEYDTVNARRVCLQCYRGSAKSDRGWASDSSASDGDEQTTEHRTGKARGNAIADENGMTPQQLDGKSDNKVGAPTDAKQPVEPNTAQASSRAPGGSEGGATTPQQDKEDAAKSTKKAKNTPQVKELRPQRPGENFSPAKTRSQSKTSDEEGKIE